MSAILFQNQYLTAYTLKDELPNTIYCVWKEVWLSKEDDALKTALSFCHKIAQEQKIRVIISDCKAISTVSLEVDAWIADWWYPTCYELGIIAEILIDSEDFMGQVAVDSFMESNKSEVMNPKVESFEEAKSLAQQILKQNPF
jgi:hypothetical protein